MHDADQAYFDGAEVILDALHSQAGCEMALREVLDPILAGRARDEQIVWALIDSMAQWRCVADQQTRVVQRLTFG